MTTLPPLPPAEDYGYRDDNGTWVQQPLYSGTDMRAYGAACAAAAREQVAQWLDAEHDREKHLHNYARWYANQIRALKEQP